MLRKAVRLGGVRMAAGLAVMSVAAVGIAADLDSATRAAGPRIEIPGATVAYYDISGQTASELQAELKRLGPHDSLGQNCHALTIWHIHWKWEMTPESTVNAKTVRTWFTAMVVLPRWIPPDGVDPRLVTRWNRFLTALADHENGHVDFARSNLQVVGDAIKKQSRAAAAEKAAIDAIQKLRRQEKEYDVKTRHGTTTGAVFP